MHIVCSKENLISNINIVLKAVPVRTTLPILECILLSVTDDGFFMLGNDLEMAIETKYIEAMIIEKGNIAVDAKRFSDIIRKLPDEDVIIKVEKDFTLYIKSGKTEFKISAQNPNEFPNLPTVEKNDKYTLPAKEFRNMIRQTIFSVATTEDKPALTGELIEIEDNTMNIVAVDSFRVSLRNFEMQEVKDASNIVPAKTLSEISKLLPTDGDREVTIYFADTHALFELDDATVVSRLIDGEFLKYKPIFTDDYTTMFTVSRSELLGSLERSMLMSTDNKKTPVKLNIDKDILVITSTAETGKLYDELSINMEGKSLEIGFNPRYLIDAIKAIETDDIVLQFKTSLSPCIIKGADTDIYKYLILPLRMD